MEHTYSSGIEVSMVFSEATVNALAFFFCTVVLDILLSHGPLVTNTLVQVASLSNLSQVVLSSLLHWVQLVSYWTSIFILQELCSHSQHSISSVSSHTVVAMVPREAIGQYVCIDTSMILIKSQHAQYKHVS